MIRALYIIEYPIGTNEIERYGMRYLTQQGADVRVLDVGDITQPTIVQNRSHYPQLGAFAPMVARTAAEFTQHAGLMTEVDVIFAILGTAGLTRKNVGIFRTIARAGPPYGMLFTNAFPGWNKYRGESGVFWRRVYHIVQRTNEIDWINSAIARIPPRWFGVRTADFVVRGGRKSALPHRLVGATTRTIPAHSMDLERFRTLQPGAGAARPFAVFIDEYLPFHPDVAQLNADPPMGADTYFPALRRLFDAVETELGLEVVVAANPRADYSTMPGIFGARRVIQHQTAQLVRDSALVISHRSTAIGLGVVANKPVILAATRAIYRHSTHRPVFDALIEALNKPVVFFDEDSPIDLSRALDIDAAAYRRFIDDYMCHPQAPDLPLWQIILDGLELGWPRKAAA